MGDFSAGEMRRFGCVLCAESSERVCVYVCECVRAVAFPYLRFSSLTVHRNFLSQLPLRILYQPVGQPTLALSRSLNHVWRRFLQTVLRGQSTEAHIVTDTHARCVGFLRAECALFVRSCPASPSRGAHSWREQVHAHGVDVAREVGLSGGLDHTVPSSPEEGHVVGVRPQHRRVLGVKHVVAAALAALLWRRRVLLDHHESA